MRDLIPNPVFASIQHHLKHVADTAASGWESNNSEEDSLTGDLGCLLRTGHDAVIIVNHQAWRWRIRYKKFRGRGPDAFERKSGADGIVQVEVTLRDETFFKGVLFQAKKGDRLGNGDLKEQVEAIEDLAPGGSAVFLYKPNGGYTAIKGTEYLHSDERLVGKLVYKMQPLASFFDEFLECKSGLRGMYYEALRDKLLVPTLDGQVKAVQLEVRHRIKIEIANT
jgi:hypothetical protein